MPASLVGAGARHRYINLIPGAPLDGGRMLRAYLWRRHGGPVRAALDAARAGRVVGVGLIGLGLVEFLAGFGVGGLGLVFIGWFLLSAARAGEAQADPAGHWAESVSAK